MKPRSIDRMVSNRVPGNAIPENPACLRIQDMRLNVNCSSGEAITKFHSSDTPRHRSCNEANRFRLWDVSENYTGFAVRPQAERTRSTTSRAFARAR